MKKNRFTLWIILFFVFQAFILGEQGSKLEIKSQGVSENIQNKKWLTKYKTVTDDDQYLLWRVVALDFLIPGYGMYTLDKHYWAGAYVLGKLTGILLIYFSVNQYLFWKPIADQFVTTFNLTSEEVFNIPGVGPLSARMILTKSDTSLIFIMLAVTFEIIISGVSIWHTIFEYSIRPQSGIYYKIDFMPQNNEKNIDRVDFKFGYNFFL